MVSNARLVVHNMQRRRHADTSASDRSHTALTTQGTTHSKLNAIASYSSGWASEIHLLVLVEPILDLYEPAFTAQDFKRHFQKATRARVLVLLALATHPCQKPSLSGTAIDSPT